MSRGINVKINGVGVKFTDISLFASYIGAMSGFKTINYQDGNKYGIKTRRDWVDHANEANRIDKLGYNFELISPSETTTITDPVYTIELENPIPKK